MFACLLSEFQHVLLGSEKRLLLVFFTEIQYG